jgi:hypothetical protein
MLLILYTSIIMNGRGKDREKREYGEERGERMKEGVFFVPNSYILFHSGNVAASLRFND